MIDIITAGFIMEEYNRFKKLTEIQREQVIMDEILSCPGGLLMSAKANNPQPQKKLIVVTGSHGFIGTHLCKHLRKMGIEPFCIDHKHNGDLFETAFRSTIQRADLVIHLAGYADARSTDKTKFNINNAVSTNYLYALNEKMILASSAACYFPGTPYADSKIRAEQYAPKALKFRFFNVYGPNGNSFINTTIHKAIKGEIIVIYGNGEQQRDYIYIDDLIDVILNEGEQGQTINIGSGMAVSCNAVVGYILEKTNSKSKVVYRSHPLTDGHDPIQKSRCGYGRSSMDLSTGINKLINFNYSGINHLKDVSAFMDWAKQNNK